MNDNRFSFETLQTMVRKAFDPETISVVVGKLSDEERRFKVVVCDEITKVAYIFHVNFDHTIAEVEDAIRKAAATLNLAEGPDRIGDEIQEPAEGAHNHD